jgi:NADH-quinone oxidoreductase subunit I
VSVKSYLRNIWHGVVTTAKGMTLTWRHFFTKPTTIQYPDEGEDTYFSPYERGLHEFEPDRCIVCYLCARACPVECITIGEDKEAKTKAGKVLTKFEIDYNKCLFCELCIEPCPVDCIHMGQQYDLTSFERQKGTIIEFTNGKGPWRTALTSADENTGVRAHIDD